MTASIDRSRPFVFVSYASRDRARVLPIIEALRGVGVQVWLDQHAIEGGASYGLEIAQAIEDCSAFVLMCSEASLASRNCRQEIALAWKYNRPYLPLLLDLSPIPKEIEYWLEAAQWVEVLDHPAEQWLPRVERSLERLGILALEPEPSAADEPVPGGDVLPATGRLYLPPEPTRLFGRERELADSRAALDAAMDAQGKTLLLSGETGIGKSALIETLVYEAALRRALILTGHSYDLSSAPAYGPWIEAARAYRPGPGLPALPTVLAEDEDSGQPKSQAALFDEVVRFLREVSARQPVMLVLEDIHWADQATLDLLRHVARQVGDTRVFIIGTYRTDELARRSPLSQLLPNLTREAGAVRIELKRLDDDAVRGLIEHQYQLPPEDRDRLVTYVQQHAEGHSLYIGELLRTLEEEGVLTPGEGNDGAWALGDLGQIIVPKLVREVIEARVAKLPEETQKALSLASVIGEDIPIEVWSEVGGESEDELLETIERAEEAHVLVSSKDGTSVRFTHALVREALYETVVPLRRRVWHRKTGEALEALPKPEPGAVAYHFKQAADARAIPWLIRSGERAERTSAYATAAEQYDEALQMALEEGDEAGQARARAAMGEVLRKQGHYQEAGVWLEEARSEFEQLSDRSGLGTALHYLGTLSAQTGDLPQSRALYEESLVIRRELNERPQMASLLSNLAIIARGSGDLERACALHDEALALRRALGDRWAVANSLNNLGNTLLDLGDLPKARQNLEEAVKLQRELGDRWALANALNNLANVVRVQGDCDTAHLLYGESLSINTELGDNWAIAYLLEDIAALSVEEGAPDRALRLIGAANRIRAEIGSPRTPAEEAKLQELLARIRAQLDAEAQSIAEETGAAMALGQAVAEALA